jgi:hypothetical protein
MKTEAQSMKATIGEIVALESSFIAWSMRPLFLCALFLVMSGLTAQAQLPSGQGQAPSPEAYQYGPGGSKGRYVGPSISRQGAYVPPHYETSKRQKFRGHYAADEANKWKTPGHKEPRPDYGDQTGSGSPAPAH